MPTVRRDLVALFTIEALRKHLLRQAERDKGLKSLFPNARRELSFDPVVTVIAAEYFQRLSLLERQFSAGVHGQDLN